MTVPQRVVGKLGRKMGVSEIGSQFKLSAYLVDPLPRYDGDDDFTNGVTDWGMAGNDVKGNCGLAGDYHYAMANALTAGEPALPVPDDGTDVCNQILAAYAAYDNGADNGVDLGQWLTWRLTNPFAGLPPIGGFAQVNDFGAEYQSALHLFGGLYTGVLISPEAMQQFQNGEPFTSTATDWEGGHCVPHLARNAQEGKLITWGAVQSFSWEWWRAAREEAYVIFTSEMMNAPGGVFNGVNVAQLKADLLTLGGTVASS